MTETYKLSRVYVDAPLNEGAEHIVSESIHHYLKNVMRFESGAQLRVFNGQDGEFLGVITEIDKKRAVLKFQKLLKNQPGTGRRVHLLFAPIKKERMDWLVEKAVELGVTDLHPILTQNTDIRKLNEEKIGSQIIEAAEQCERMDIPVLHPVEDVWKVLSGWVCETPILAAIERVEEKSLKDAIPAGDVAFLIGPAGGFTAEEKEKMMKMREITPISLGEAILRAETAAIAALSRLIP
jgi:16S rRNA (uracil1498-N3)-methyltransferase